MPAMFSDGNSDGNGDGNGDGDEVVGARVCPGAARIAAD